MQRPFGRLRLMVTRRLEVSERRLEVSERRLAVSERRLEVSKPYKHVFRNLANE